MRACLLVALVTTSAVACLQPPRQLDGLACDDAGRCGAGYTCVSGACVAHADTTPADASVPDRATADARVRDAERSDALVVDAAIPDSVVLDRTAVDAPVRDRSPSDAATADATRPDASGADLGIHDNGQADTRAVDAGARDRASTDGWTPPGLLWVPLPGNTFQMGCSPGDMDCDYDEVPRHAVTVAAFEIMATEITQQQYLAVIGDNPSQFSDCPVCPVERITWQQAKEFCLAIGGRLPSEAEWEYAARAGTTTRYYCGDQASCLDEIAWHGGSAGMETHHVGELVPNAFELYDMLGNAWEWNEDCYHGDYTGAPATGSVWSGGVNEDCSYRMLRGGPYYGDNIDLRSSARDRIAPGFLDSGIGARCAR